jgi:hypothetical protein
MLPYEETPDDGATILHFGDEPLTCADCGKGKLRDGAAMFLPHHRICEICGSHWDLHGFRLELHRAEEHDEREVTDSSDNTYRVERQGYPWRAWPGDEPFSRLEVILKMPRATVDGAVRVAGGRPGFRGPSILKVVPAIKVHWARRARFY